MNAFEVNFDGLVGPTHHYGGLAAGNLASQQNRLTVSRPRAAALEGLAKMKLLADLGVRQAVLPPHPRPHWEFLKQHGFQGSSARIIEQAAQQRPDLLSIAYSSAAMWTANAATISPSADTTDGRVHITPANLISTPHRVLESEQTTHVLRRIFHDSRHFVVLDPLPHSEILADEGAANQLRLCPAHAAPGIEVFVYGRDADSASARQAGRFLARQTRQASERVAALHQLPVERRCFVQQNPVAIDAGVFHNDVISLANEQVLLCHERAFVDQSQVLQLLRQMSAGELCVIEISDQELSLAEAVSTYLFNSQLITFHRSARASSSSPSKEMLLLCPGECETHLRARQVIGRIVTADNPICDVRFVNVRQSMRNGGGPACLRLRVVLNETELSSLDSRIFLTDALYEKLTTVVQQHYREELTIADLADPELAMESQTAQMEFEQLLFATNTPPGRDE